MAHDFTNDVDSLYDALAYDATLETTPQIALKVLDSLAGIEITDGVGMSTVKPALGVRISELDSHGLTLIDVINEDISYGGLTYRIRDARQMPTPGANSGQAWLILVE